MMFTRRKGSPLVAPALKPTPPGVRLPAMPAPAYDPPVLPPMSPPPATPFGSAGRIESITVQQPFRANQERIVYTTKGTWRAIDVYIDISSLPSFVNSTWTVFVYAVSDRTRTLVASGRVVSYTPPAPGDVIQGTKWIAAARSQATRFEVTVHYTDSNGAPIPSTTSGVVPITIAASDESDSAPEELGAVPVADHAIAGGVEIDDVTSAGLGGLPFWPSPELLKIYAIVDEAVVTPRYLHVYVAQAAVAIAGAPGILVFPIAPGVAAAGGGLYVTDVRFRFPDPRFSLSVLASSTAALYTPANDVFVNAVVR